MTEGRSPYEAIINHPHHVSRNHPQMPIEKRAAQFSPFKAMVGYEEEVDEVSRYTDSERLLDENRKEELDWRLQTLMKRMGQGERVELSIEYFVDDDRKDGGSYVIITGIVKKLDLQNRLLVLETGENIPIAKIYDIAIN
ncbi:MAG: hypothetical protein K5989_06300 [Lachnospiraceae bacterium]|nr:hypothetical protein [Lachnospiraceae bacterium]